MLSIETLNNLCNKLHTFMQELDFYCLHEIPPEPEWVAALVGLFGGDAFQAIQLLDSIDFNNESNLHLLSYFPAIVQSMPTFGAKFLVIEHYKQLKNKFPNVHFSTVIRWSMEDAGFPIGANSNSTDDEPLDNKLHDIHDVHFDGSL